MSDEDKDDVMDENDMAAAMSEEAPAKADAPEEKADENISFEEITDDGSEEKALEKDLTAIYDIPVQISAVLGRSNMQVSQLLKLGRGAVVELDRRVGEAIDIYVNNRLVARGEVVVVEDKLGITMTEIVKSDRS
jgi:flagellar motor switch protein FliN/FliY